MDAYAENRIKSTTWPSKEDDRVHQIDAINSITGPVLTFIGRILARRLLDAASADEPDAVAANVNGARHELWTVSDPAAVAEIANAVNAMDALYIADGHHRSAAGARVAEARRNANPDHDGSEPYNGFLAVSFPDDEVEILDYNRVIKDLNGLDSGAFLESLFNLPRRAGCGTARRAVVGSYVSRWPMVVDNADRAGRDR